VGKSGLFAPTPLSPRLDGILYQAGAMNVESIIAEPLDLAAMRQLWVTERPRLRQGMRVLAYQPLSDAYRELRTLDQVYNTPEPLPGIPDTWSVQTPQEPSILEEGAPESSGLPSPDVQPDREDEELPGPTLPASDAELDAEDEASGEERNLDLRGETSQESAFDLLSSPFSQGEAFSEAEASSKDDPFSKGGPFSKGEVEDDEDQAPTSSPTQTANEL
jgi:hypothetical protein